MTNSRPFLPEGPLRVNRGAQAPSLTRSEGGLDYGADSDIPFALPLMWQQRDTTHTLAGEWVLRTMD